MISIVIRYFKVSGMREGSVINNERYLITLLGSYETRKIRSQIRNRTLGGIILIAHIANARVSGVKDELVNVSAATEPVGKFPALTFDL